MYSLGVFPARRVLPQLLGTFFERVWKLLEIHDEFNDLTTAEKRLVLGRNFHAGMGLMFVKNDRTVRIFLM